MFKAISGTVTSFYNYDAQGERARKIVEKTGQNIKEVRIYFSNFEVYRKYVNDVLETERTTIHISDGQRRIAFFESLTVEAGVTLSTPQDTVRYQYDNHLGSASLELDQTAATISYEEYHPFGTSSYRLHRNSTEASQKRYRYVGKERDEETGLYYYGARYYAAWIGRWIAVDPKAKESQNKTPYHYCSNNPINKIDPDGKLDELVITGDATDKAIEHLEKGITMKLIRNPNTGRVEAIGEAKTENDKKLLRVIKDTDITVNLITSNSNLFTFKGENYGTKLGGSFLGNTVTKSSFTYEFQTGIKPFETDNYTVYFNKVEAYQFANPEMLEAFDIFVGVKGEAILHEVTEAYSGALISQKTGISAEPAAKSQNSTYWIYDQAHSAKTTVPQPGDNKITFDDIESIRKTKTK